MKILGIILVIVGVICLAVPSVTYFTQRRVADTGYFHIDVNEPHTIILNPALGAIALIAGVLVLLCAPRRN